MLKRILLLLGTISLLSTSIQAAEQLPSITASYLKQAPVIDGKLDEACWQSAETASHFVRVNNNGLAKEQTNAKVGYDDRFLYVGFECLESQMDKTVSVYKKDGQPVWQDDCIELFVSPFSVAEYLKYVHFGVNISGTKSVEISGEGTTQISWEAATSKAKDRWFVEIAIPLTILKPSGINENCWRINFCRAEVRGNEYSSWSPVSGFSRFLEIRTSL
jgi:sarcosine oxidase delta subunit